MSNDKNRYYVSLVADPRPNTSFENSTRLLQEFLGQSGNIEAIDEEGYAVVKIDTPSLVEDLKAAAFVEPTNGIAGDKSAGVYPYHAVTMQEDTLESPGLTA